MARSVVVQDCLFCEIVSAPSSRLRWHDRPLVQVPGLGAVIVGLGAFVPGYVIVFPEQHVESVLKIPRNNSHAFDRLVQKTVEAVSSTFEVPTLFEHGACPLKDVRRSACLDHAHIHVLPGSYELSSHVTNQPGGSLDRSAVETQLDRSGYLFLHEPTDDPVYGMDPGVSQFFRRLVAEKLGIPDEWDYLLFPRLENVSETITRLRQVFNLDNFDLGDDQRKKLAALYDWIMRTRLLHRS